MGCRERFQRRHANAFEPERKGKPAGGGNTDANAGKGTGADDDGNLADRMKIDTGFIQRLIDDGHQPFGMALADFFGDGGQQLSCGTVE